MVVAIASQMRPRACSTAGALTRPNLSVPAVRCVAKAFKPKPPSNAPVALILMSTEGGGLAGTAAAACVSADQPARPRGDGCPGDQCRRLANRHGERRCTSPLA